MGSTVSLENSRQSYFYLKEKFHPHQEEFWVIALNPQLQILAGEALFRGTVNVCPTHPRELFAFLLAHRATSFLVAHNHPTGLSLPSRSDLAVTRKIWKLSKLIQIHMNDHLILGSDGYTSLADRGFFKSLKPN